MHELHAHDKETKSDRYESVYRVRQVSLKNGIQKLAAGWLIALAFGFGAPNGALGLVEMCGDEIDNDGAGGDQLCDSPDQDGDGYYSNGGGPNPGVDCDDLNRWVYPGVAIQTGCSGGEARNCQADGTYSACSTGGWCPAGYTCKYINPSTGNNSNAGTFASPWLNSAMFNTYYSGGEPSGYTAPAAATAFIYRGGTVSYEFTYSSSKFGFLLRGRNGSLSQPIRLICYPGETCTVTMATSSANPMTFFQGSNIRVEGDWRITGNTCSGQGLTDTGCLVFDTCDYCNFSRARVYGNTGITVNNLTGIYVGNSNNSGADHVLLYDNIGDIPDNPNNTNFVIFRGTNNYLTDSIVYFTTRNSKVNIKAPKHANYASNYNIERNIWWNGQFQSGARNLVVKNNRSEDGEFVLEDLGGPTHSGDVTIKNNTFLNAGIGRVNPTKGWNQNGTAAADVCSGDSVIGVWDISGNVITDDRTSQSAGSRFFDMGQFLPDQLYSDVEGGNKFQINNNCYYSPSSAPTFGYFESNNGNTTCAGRGNSGTSYTFANWKAFGKDITSFEENPTFDSRLKATSTNCLNKGWNIGLGGSGGNVSAKPKGAWARKR